MKKLIALFLAAFLLAGCQPSNAGGDTPTETANAPTEAVSKLEITAPAPSITPAHPGESLAFSNPGKARIAYTGNRSYVQYITSVDQLPDEEALKGYDAEFFENNALLIVVETVSSGSAQLELERILLDGDTAAVTLKRSMPGEVGTTDMATWLLWAEVAKDLDYNWVLESGNNLPQE